MPRITNRAQSIYVIVAPTGECKIGIGENPAARVTQINNVIPRGVCRLAFQSVASPDIWRFETAIHRMLSHRRLNGEWFDVGEAAAVALVKRQIGHHLGGDSQRIAENDAESSRAIAEILENASTGPATIAHTPNSL